MPGKKNTSPWNIFDHVIAKKMGSLKITGLSLSSVLVLGWCKRRPRRRGSVGPTSIN